MSSTRRGRRRCEGERKILNLLRFDLSRQIGIGGVDERRLCSDDDLPALRANGQCYILPCALTRAKGDAVLFVSLETLRCDPQVVRGGGSKGTL